MSEPQVNVSPQQKSLVDIIREDPYRNTGYYAATLALNVQMLLQNALASRPDLSIEAISELLGVDEERVRWAYSLNGPDDIPAGVSYTDWSSNGNMHTASLARFFRVLGYELEITVKAVDDKADAEFVNTPPRIRSRRMRKPASVVDPDTLNWEI